MGFVIRVEFWQSMTKSWWRWRIETSGAVLAEGKCETWQAALEAAFEAVALRMEG
jgi:hypothetical protein